MLPTFTVFNKERSFEPSPACYRLKVAGYSVPIRQFQMYGNYYNTCNVSRP